MIARFALLALAMKSLPLGTAYTVWTGIGAVGAFIVGIAVLANRRADRRGAPDPQRFCADEMDVTGLSGQAS